MDYNELSDTSRVWIYQSDRQLSNEELKQIKEKGDAFVDGWAAHGSNLKASFEIFHNRFLVLFADESQTNASGCSIDSSVRFIKELEKDFKLDLFNRMNVAYEGTESIQTVPMKEFEQLIQSGDVTESTIVYNNHIQNLEEFKSKWEIPLKDSWHSRMLV